MFRSWPACIIVSALACGDTASGTGSAPTGAAEDTTGGETSEDTSASDSWTGGPDPTESGDAGTDTEGGPKAAPDVLDFDTCELDWGPSASVSGDTPHGFFDGRFAWFGWVVCDGEGLSPTIVIAESAADLAAAVAQNAMGDAVPSPSMEWFLFGACSPAGGWVGEGKVQVYLRHAGPWDLGEGLIQVSETYRIFDEVDPEDPPRMSGHISVRNQAGWDIEGDFEAAYCGPLSYSIQCE